MAVLVYLSIHLLKDALVAYKRWLFLKTKVDINIPQRFSCRYKLQQISAFKKGLWYGTYMFSLFMNYKTLWYRGCTVLHPHQHRWSTPVCPHTRQALRVHALDFCPSDRQHLHLTIVSHRHFHLYLIPYNGEHISYFMYSTFLLQVQTLKMNFYSQVCECFNLHVGSQELNLGHLKEHL